MSATVTTEPTGKKAGTVTTAATAGSLGGSGLGVLVAYLMVKSGFEPDAETAVVVGGVIASLIAGVAAFVAGKLTPTNQVKTVTTVVEAPAVDHAAKEAAAVGADVNYQPKHAA